MSRKRTHEVEYLVCVYMSSTPIPTVIGRFHKRDKAEKFLTEYLNENDFINRAYIEKAQSFKNDKRNMWDF